MTRRMLAPAAGATAIASVVIVAGAAPASAHGLGGRVDLPLPVWQLAWAAGFAVAISFVALGTFWKSPRLTAAAGGTPMPSAPNTALRMAEPFLRVFGVVAFAVVLVGAWWGNPRPSLNIAPQVVYIWFWVGVQFASLVFGDFWRSLNPFFTIADAAARVRSRLTGTPLSECPDTPATVWPAVAAIFGFVWMELAYHSPSSARPLGLYLTAYATVMLGGAAIRGRSWVREADGFALLFSMLGAVSPLHRDADGILKWRAPLSGLSRMQMPPGSIPFILIVLGSTSFDGFTRNSLWREAITNRRGWDLTLIRTVGLIIALLIVSGAFLMAIEAMSRITGDSRSQLLDAFGPSLVPILGAYSVAHYFSFLLLDGQVVYRLISDPFGKGWDVFGTVGYRIRYTAISPRQIAWAQTLAIAVGHVLAVATAHDRSVERYRRSLAVRSQYPMLGVMIAYTVLGLVILLAA